MGIHNLDQQSPYFLYFIAQLSVKKTARDLEKKDEQLNASRKILEEQEDELLVCLVLFILKDISE